MSSPVEDQLIYVEIRENVFFIIWKTSSNINSATSAQPLTSLLPSKCNWQWSCIFITGHNIFYALDCVWPTNFVFLHVADVSCKICRPWCSSLRDTLSGSDLVLLHHLLSNNPHWLHYESVCVIKTTTRSAPDWRSGRRACVCLYFLRFVFFDILSVLLWKVTGCHIVVSVHDFLSAWC